MNIYHPYEVLADTNDCLHLKEGESRERFQFILSRVLPVFLIMFLWFVLQQVGASIPMGWIYLLSGITLLVAGLLLLRPYVTELKVVPQKELFIVQKTIFGTREKNISRNDIENIILFRRRGKARGAFFVMEVKPHKSVLLLSIPASYVDEHHLKLVKERLEDLLNITIVQQK